MPRQAWVWGRWTTLLPVAVAFWSLIALMNATQMYIGFRGEGLPFANGLTPFLKWQEPLWLVWALLTPVVAWLAARYPLRVAAFPILVHLAAGLACALVRSAAGEFITIHLAPFPSGQDPRTYLERLVGRMTSTLHIELLVYWGLVTVFHAFDFYAKYRDREIAATRLERQLVSAQLETLRLQLDPHFLFNALQLLRQSLNTSGRQKVPLSGELDILRHYIDIQETRFPDRLHVALHVERDVEQALVPTLILQPLVENAIRHGIARLDRPGQVTIAAHRADERLRLEVSDDGPGLDTPSREAGAGVGLDNTRARLAGLYGAAQSFALHNRAGGGVTASITLPLELEGTS
jgi:two-component system, LytTR family, sensor kinase